MVVWFRITQEDRKRLNTSALVFHPQSPAEELLSFASCYMGLPERNLGTAGQKGRARKTLWLQLQIAEAGFPGSNCL